MAAHGVRSPPSGILECAACPFHGLKPRAVQLLIPFCKASAFPERGQIVRSVHAVALTIISSNAHHREGRHPTACFRLPPIPG